MKENPAALEVLWHYSPIFHDYTSVPFPGIKEPALNKPVTKGLHGT
jgi:hypothetical protein